jgi:hypothetical protein
MIAQAAYDADGKGLQYKCPSCKIPIRVGQHSITIDSERLKAEAMKELVNAAIDIRDNPGTDAHGSVGFCAIELPKLDWLRDALAALDSSR